MYLPDITKAAILRHLEIDEDHSAVLLGNIEANGSPQPLFVVRG